MLNAFYFPFSSSVTLPAVSYPSRRLKRLYASNRRLVRLAVVPCVCSSGLRRVSVPGVRIRLLLFDGRKHPAGDAFRVCVFRQRVRTMSLDSIFFFIETLCIFKYVYYILIYFNMKICDTCDIIRTK